MASRILTWQTLEAFGNKLDLGAYYMEADYSVIAVRIKAQTAPVVEDAVFDIYNNGVSIFSDNGATLRDRATGKVTSVVVDTTIHLPVGDTEETDAEDFRPELILSKGSWITCNCIKDGGGRNLSVHLELFRVSEEDEE